MELVDGIEGTSVCQALVDSIQAAEDYGAYQGTLRASCSFPAPELGAALDQGLLGIRARHPDWACDLLASLILDAECERTEQITAFNDALRQMPRADCSVFFGSKSCGLVSGL